MWFNKKSTGLELVTFALLFISRIALKSGQKEYPFHRFVNLTRVYYSKTKNVEKWLPHGKIMPNREKFLCTYSVPGTVRKQINFLFYSHLLCATGAVFTCSAQRKKLRFREVSHYFFIYQWEKRQNLNLNNLM